MIFVAQIKNQMKKLFVIATLVSFSFCVATAQTTPATGTQTPAATTTTKKKTKTTTKVASTTETTPVKKGGKKSSTKKTTVKKESTDKMQATPAAK